MQASEDEGSVNSPSESELGSEPESPTDAMKWSKYTKLFGLDKSSDRNHNISSFDAYFSQASRSSKTSANVFSHLVPNLTFEEYDESISSFTKASSPSQRKITLEEIHIGYFQNYLTELAAGFNLLFYGLGSKRNILNKFARYLTRTGHVLVANAFSPDFDLSNFLSSLEQVTGVTAMSNITVTPDDQCRRILSQYSQVPPCRHLFVVMHNIDSMHFRTTKLRSCLALLAAHPSIHLIASVDHILASSLWSTSEIFTGYQNYDRGICSRNAQRGGFSWLYHDLTTMESYDFELSYADRTSFSGASTSASKHGSMKDVGVEQGGVISESAAQHVLASVTNKAKRLFALLCQRQLDAIQAASTEPKLPIPSSAQVATSYETLFSAARDEFIATNDTSMRALLGEFRDHGLVISASSIEGDSLWIPLSSDILSRLVKAISVS